MNEASFKKGEAFEDFVSKHIFITNDYNLIHRTNSYEQNKQRYVENSLKPDFKFECKNSGKCFYVEAKYRTRFDNNSKIEVLTLQQYKRFKDLENDEKCPIFVIVGYGGYPDNPTDISIIPLKDIEYSHYYESTLRKFNINIEPIPYTHLKLDDYHLTPLDTKIEESVIEEKSSKQKKLLIPIIAACIISILAFTYLTYNTNTTDKTTVETTIQEELKKVIDNYYKELNHNQLSNLHNYINPVVNTWYSKTNVSLEDIIKQQLAYQKKYPLRETLIIWDTFTIEIVNNDYHVTYHLDYKLKAKGAKDYKYYKLKIFSVWDANYKLKSMSEVRL